MLITFPSTNSSLPFRRKTKRSNPAVYLILNSDGTVSVTDNCSDALLFWISNGTLTANGLYAQVTPAIVTSVGMANFTFGPNNPSDLEGAFSYPGGEITWSNALFTGVEAEFAFPTSGVGLVIVIFNGNLPLGYTPITLTAIMTDGSALGK